MGSTVALAVARNVKAGVDGRELGVAGIPKPLAQAVDMGDVLIDQQPELLDPVLASPQSSGSRLPELHAIRRLVDCGQSRRVSTLR
jgi:hypothetical protein